MSRLYSTARQSFLTGAINWNTDTFGVLLCTNTYVPSLNTDQFVSIIPSGAITARAALSSLSSTAGQAHAANVNFASVSGSAIVFLIVYKNTGSDATSPLICMIDAASGLPVFPSGTPVAIAWDSTNGIFIL